MFKSVILAAMAVAGIGSTASAATVRGYNLELRYEGTEYTDFEYFELPHGDSIYSLSSYPKENPLGLDLNSFVFPGLVVGDVIRFVARIEFPDDETNLIGQYDNGGRAPVCRIDKISCINTSQAYQIGMSAFEIYYSDSFRISGSDVVGSEFTYYKTYIGLSGVTSDGRFGYYSRDQESYFTVVAQLAPVPLPASATLLPLGFGAFAMMRKRRRKVS